MMKKISLMLIAITTLLISCNPTIILGDNGTQNSTTNNNNNGTPPIDNGTPPIDDGTPPINNEPSYPSYLNDPTHTASFDLTTTTSTNFINIDENGKERNLQDLRIRGYIVPESQLDGVKMYFALMMKIKENEQTYMTVKTYNSTVKYLSDMLVNGYDNNLLATEPVLYPNEAEILFNIKTSDVRINNEIIPFINQPNPQGIKAEDLLTKDQTWHLNDVMWLESTDKNMPFPTIGSKYYILWMLEGFDVYSNRMMIRIIGQDLKHLSLYTVVP